MTRIALASVNRSMVTVRPLIWISGIAGGQTVYAALSPFHSSIVYGVVVGASVPPSVTSAKPPPGFGAGASGTSQLIDGSVIRSSFPVWFPEPDRCFQSPDQ